MRPLTDAEIISALPEETRQKINNSFESLSQASPSAEEQAILYRVAHTLKLQPTDTIFSIMSALHFYLQLYNIIPGKIKLASEDADKKIRDATKKTLTEHAIALKAQTALLVAQTQSGLTNEVGRIAQQIAGNAAEATAAQAKTEAARWQAGALAVGLLAGAISTYLAVTGAHAMNMSTAKDMVAAAELRAETAEADAKKRADEVITAISEKSGAAVAAIAARNSWATSTAGRVAHKLAEAGDLGKIAGCSGEGWKKKEDASGTLWCHIPQSDGFFSGTKLVPQFRVYDYKK